MEWQDRFVKREYIRAGDLAKRFNIKNPRQHPETQNAAVEKSLDNLGWIDDISLSTNGDGPPSLADNPDAVYIDGEDRTKVVLVKWGPDALIPCRWYQLSPQETDAALKYKDASAAMAEINWPKWEALEIANEFVIQEVEVYMGAVDHSILNIDQSSSNDFASGNQFNDKGYQYIINLSLDQFKDNTLRATINDFCERNELLFVVRSA